jgi:hypothetical protein
MGGGRAKFSWAQGCKILKYGPECVDEIGLERALVVVVTACRVEVLSILCFC